MISGSPLGGGNRIDLQVDLGWMEMGTGGLRLRREGGMRERIQGETEQRSIWGVVRNPTSVETSWNL